MPTLVIPANVAACHVDDFHPGCERSRRGSVVLKPATTVHVTDGELEHIKASHPELYAKLIVAKPATLGDKLKDRLSDDAPLKKAVEAAEERGRARRAAEAKAAAAALTPEQKEAAKQAEALAVHQAKKKAQAQVVAKAEDEAPKKPTPLPPVPEKKPRKVGG